MEDATIRKKAIALTLEHLRVFEKSISAKIDELEEHQRLIEQELGQKEMGDYA